MSRAAKGAPPEQDEPAERAPLSAPPPPATHGFSFLQAAPWHVHPLCGAMEDLPEELSQFNFSDRLPSRLARMPFANGWSASIILFGQPQNPSALFEIALVSPGQGGLRHDSIMAYMSAAEANEVLGQIERLPAFDAPLRLALSSGSLKEAGPLLRQARREGALKAFNGAVSQGHLTLPSYAAEALRDRKSGKASRSGPLDTAFALRAWSALIKAGAELTADDFDSALSAQTRRADDEASEAALASRLSEALFGPIFKLDHGLGGSLAARAISSASAELAPLLSAAFARFESEELGQAAAASSPQRRAGL